MADEQSQAPAKVNPLMETLLAKDAPEFFAGLSLAELAGVLEKGGITGKSVNFYQVVAKLLLAKSMGIEPIVGIREIVTFDGTIFIGANLRASQMRKHGYYWTVNETNDSCSVTIFKGVPGKGGVELGTATFTLEEAKTAGLSGKNNWRNYSNDMLYARASSRAQRRFAPEVLGGHVAYDLSERGAIVEAQAEEADDAGELAAEILAKSEAIDVEFKEVV